MQWYRFESRTTLNQALLVPFDLIYLVPTADLPRFGKVYDVYLKLKPSEEFRTNLGARRLDEFEYPGKTRDDAVRQVAFPKEDSSLEKNCPDFHADWMTFCVPILPRRRGDEVGPTYLVSKELQRKFNNDLEKLKTVDINLNRSANKVLTSIVIVAGGKEMPPCFACNQALTRLANPSHCAVGTESCFANVSFSSRVKTFKDNAAKGQETAHREDLSHARV